MAPNVIAALFQNASVPEAVAVAGIIGFTTYELSTFCLTDPPAMPTITPDDIAYLFQPLNNPLGYYAAINKFRDAVGHLVWPTVCQCTNGTAVTPSPLTWPTGAPVFNPPQVAPGYPTGQPCSSFTYTNSATPPNVPSPDNPIVPLPTGATHARMTLSPSRPMVTADATGYAVILNCFNAAGTFIGNPVAVGASSSGATLTASGALVAGTASFRVTRSVSHVDTPITFTTVTDFFCGSAPGGGQVPLPCVADPILTTQVQAIYDLVTLIQRQAVPFAYVRSTVHSALFGNGEIGVQGLIGALVEVTARGGHVGEVAGDPSVLFDAGWINWGNGDGVTERQRISADSQISFPLAAGQFTSLHYSASVGVVLRITELVREP